MAGNLTARKVLTAKPGKYSDGNNLYLVVSPSGARKWVCRFMWRGRAKEMGLGGASTVSLAEAREKAAAAVRSLKAGQNPIVDRKRAGGIPTFGEFADEVVATLSSGFRNPKHRAQWKMTLATYASPLRSLPIDTITTDDVLEVLQPIWTFKAETASRLRGRIEKVLDAAKAKGFRDGENPARWRGHLDLLLPKQNNLVRRHHVAMRYDEVPAFFASLRDSSTLACNALKFCILTAGRTGEVLGMRWSEVDLNTAIWSVPKERMKAGRPHRVPLSGRALALLRQLQQTKGDGELVFPGGVAGKPLSNMAMAMVLRRMKLDVTVHGFRSSFRDWAGNETSFPREIAETALAHVVGDRTEQAYRRDDALKRRRELMEAWASFCSEAENVIPLTPRALASR